jgi:shikimate kinase
MEPMSLEHRDDWDRSEGEAPDQSGSNVILVGAMSSGKSTSGWLLARMIGYGFIDLDAAIEARTGKTVAEIFEQKGEEAFRDMETDLLREIEGIRSHVIACGGGAVMRDDNWSILSRMGTTVWVNTPPEEIARRLVATSPMDQESGLERLKRRPLLADLADVKDAEQRHDKLTERMKALIGQRAGRYRQCRITVADSFSTPESTAALIKDVLLREGILKPSHEQRPYDRWRTL